jgi:hypothetical protein
LQSAIIELISGAGISCHCAKCSSCSS